ncbi:MAG: glycosyltransferase family 2 protein [Lentisphaerota bacterium]
MSQGDACLVTILVPHYQTLDSIRICLRSLRKYTRQPYRVRVLDNGSADESIGYLRSLKWIDLVHACDSNHIWKSHYTALNKAVADVDTPCFLIMHSDTYVHDPRWLDYLLDPLRRGYAGVGPRHQRIPVRTPGWTVLAGLQSLRARKWKPGVPIVRSFCALYEVEPFRKLGCQFVTRDGEDITCEANEKLVQHGCRLMGLPAFRLSKFLFHASAVTLIAQGTPPADRHQIAEACRQGGSYLDHHTYRRSSKMLSRFMALPSTQEILSDETLDA